MTDTRKLSRYEQNEITASVIGVALLRAYRMTLPDETGTKLREQMQARGQYMDRQHAVAHYRRVSKAAAVVMAAAGMEYA